MSDSLGQDPYAPPPPPPPPQSAPVTAQNPGVGYQPTQPMPVFQTTGPIPTFAPSAPAAPSPAQVAPRSAGADFFRSLLDVSFTTYITRRMAGVFYVIGLVAIGIGAVGALFRGLAGAFAAMSNSYTSGAGILVLFASLIGVPLIALVLVIALRLSLEAGVALIAIAENTRKLPSDDSKN